MRKTIRGILILGPCGIRSTKLLFNTRITQLSWKEITDNIITVRDKELSYAIDLNTVTRRRRKHEDVTSSVSRCNS